MSRLKPLLPTLKEKKRYVAFEVITDGKPSSTDVSKTIWNSVHNFVGTKGAALMGLHIFNDKYKHNKGLLRVTHTQVDPLKASLALIHNINQQPVIIRTLGVSGILQKAEQYI